MSETLTVSAVQEQEDVDVDRVAGGTPLTPVKEVPVYARSEVPEHLRTMTELKADRLKPAEGQQPVAFLRVYRRGHGWGRFPLYDPAGAARMRPLSARQRRNMQERRTCTGCGEVFPRPVYGMCDPCRTREVRRQRDLHQRTCHDCGTVFNTPAPVQSWQGGQCLACQERIERGRKVARSLSDRSCRRCLVQLVPLARWAGMSEQQRVRADWHCGPCDQEIAHERLEAQRQADRDRWDDLGPTIAWAQEILADPDAHAVLDTETTGLHPAARIVEIAVTTASGTVLLNTLINPGEAIPPEATAIHGIDDAMVAGAPSFSDVLPRLTEALAGRKVVIYNSEYDTSRLRWELHLHHLAQCTVDLDKHPRNGQRHHPAVQAWMAAQMWEECAMEQYATFFGDWSQYWGSYTWQRLNGGHRALDDCLTVISRLQEMAAYPSPFDSTAPAPVQ